ncbi:MAG: ABC transporter permease [Anaerolineales bacterium]|jgi:spermidine/putrescine transport system permease protein|nr:ABC transporter permease [Anaerolineales bacterium]|tara:strand:- start:427 stop:1242 length:816 start_codon:yes stop_codon:yes gene_type:complete
MRDVQFKKFLSPASIYFWIFAVFLYFPIFLLVILSFNDSALLRFPLKGFTLDWYKTVLRSHELVGALQNSVVVGVVSSVVSGVLGTMAAIGIVRFRFPGRNLFLAISALPLVIPAIVIGVALLILFRSILDVDLSLWTLGLSHVVINIPIVMLIVASRLAGMDANLEEAAMDLGASYWTAQLRVTLPIVFPALIAAFLTAFTTSFDEYAMSVFVVGTKPTLPVYMYSMLRFPRKIPVVVTMASIILVASIALIFLAEQLRRAGQNSTSKVR